MRHYNKTYLRNIKFLSTQVFNVRKQKQKNFKNRDKHANNQNNCAKLSIKQLRK